MYSNVFDVIYFEVSEIRENKKCKYLENENFFSSYETIHCTLRAIMWQKIFFLQRGNLEMHATTSVYHRIILKTKITFIQAMF